MRGVQLCRSILLRLSCLIIVIVASFVNVKIVDVPEAHASAGIVVTQGASTIGTTAWLTPANAYGTSADGVYATAAPAKNGTKVGYWATYGFDSALPANPTITKVEIIPRYKVNTVLSVSSLDVQAVVSGTNCPTTAINDASEPLVDTDFIADVTSCRTWTRSDLLDANFKTLITAKRGSSTTTPTFSLDYVKVRVTFSVIDYAQASYGIFKNNDSTNVGSTLAASNTPAQVHYPSAPFRLRLLVGIGTLNLAANGESFKLQYVGKGSGTCMSPSGGSPSVYTDVTAGTLIAYNDNPSPVTNSSITNNAADPTDGANTVISQTYIESNNFTNPTIINAGQDGKWDFSLKDNGAPASTTYCLRAVLSTGTLLDTYSVYPEVTTSAPGSLTASIVAANGTDVTSPAFALSAVTTPFVCSNSTGTFGTTSQRIRISNTLSSLGWSASIAATGGKTALWSSGTPKYDFNDPAGSPSGCAAGLDSDTYAGRLSLNPSAGTITSQSNCANTGVSLGGSAAFSENVTDSITLLNGSSSAELGCYWDLTGVGISQYIPADQKSGNYSLNLTMTVVSN